MANDSSASTVLPDVQRTLLAWYEGVKRPLPWRRTRDPYAIWISEIMCQQTRVDTVIPYYERWMGAFPTVYDLANAPIDDLLLLWQGLGYYRRARHLHAAAQCIVADHQGRVPNNSKALRTLPGIGPYTASAIASIAYGEPSPALDGNMLRVMSRLYADPSDISKPSSVSHFRRLATPWTQHPEPGQLNQALMELGATVCTPTNPQCDRCPLQTICRAHAEGTQERYPVKSAKPKVKIEHRHAWIIERARDQAIYLAQRCEDQLLGGLWEMPLMTTAPTSDLFVPYGDMRHLFTHIDLRVSLWIAHDDIAPPTLPDIYQRGRWVRADDMAQLPQSTLMKKMHARYTTGFRNGSHDTD